MVLGRLPTQNALPHILPTGVYLRVSFNLVGVPHLMQQFLGVTSSGILHAALCALPFWYVAQIHDLNT